MKLSFILRRIVQNWTDLLHFISRHILFFVPNLAKTDAIVLSIFAFTAGTIFLAPAAEAGKNAKRWREIISVAYPVVTARDSNEFPRLWTVRPMSETGLGRVKTRFHAKAIE